MTQVADLLQQAIQPIGRETERIVDNAIKAALLDLVDALAYADNNPNRAEYIETLIGLHRGEPHPILAAIRTAATWLEDTRSAP